MKSLLLLAATLAAAFAPPAGAQAELEDTRTIYALNLFGAACMSHLGDPDQTSAWAGLEQFPRIEQDQLAPLLQGRPAYGWNASGPNGEALLILREDGYCSVWARRAVAAQAQAFVDAMMAGAASAGTRAERTDDRMVDGRGGQYRLVAYRLSTADSGRQFVVSCTTTEADNDQVLAQLILSVGEIQPR
jgi:hypothetical protein